MPPLSQEHKHQTLVQLRSGVFYSQSCRFSGMSQSSVAHLRKDIGGEIERQWGGCPKLLANQEKRPCVTLDIEDRLGTTFVTSKQLRFKTCILLSHITVRHALREVGLGAQAQQRNPFFCVVNMFSHAWGFLKGTIIGTLMIGNAWFPMTRQR